MKTGTIADTIFNIAHSYRLAIRSTLKANEIGLNAMHAKCLSFIKRSEICTANDIVNYLARDKAQIARLIKEMIAKKWLIKTAHPKDKRSQLLSLTEEGKVLAELIALTQRQMHKKIKKNLTVEELQEFQRIANIMAYNLQADKTSV